MKRTTFVVGQEVRWNKYTDSFPFLKSKYGDVAIVEDVKNAPSNSGVEHHQWLFLKNYGDGSSPVSGLFFEPDEYIDFKKSDQYQPDQYDKTIYPDYWNPNDYSNSPNSGD